MNAANFLAYAAQLTVVVLVCAGLPRLLGLRSPGLQYAFWRVVLAVCLVLPFAQPRRAHEMVFVPVPAAPAVVAPGPPPLARAVPPESLPFDWVTAVQVVLLAGIVVRLLWIGAGLVRLRAMRRRSAAQETSAFEDLQDAIGTRAPVLWSADVRHPVTFGILKPVVLLPVALKAVDRAAQRAVVAHELNHVRRRDWVWVLAEEVVRSIFWFHPAMWWLISRVQLARETVVDELSILATNARRTYLDTLLAFADDTGLTSSPAFSARRHLFHRVMLLSKEGGMSSTRIALGSCVLIVALGAGSAGAVAAFPLYGVAQAGQLPPRDPLTPDAHHRVAQQYWDKANKDLTLTREEKLETIAKGIAADDRALAMNPDYIPALTYKSIFLRMQANLTADSALQARLLQQADELREKVLTLRGVPPPPPPPPPRPVRATPDLAPPPPPPPPLDAEMVFMPAEFQQHVDELKPLKIGGALRPPMKVRDVKPVYPPIARSARVQGVVIVEALIDGAGRVADVRILRSIPLLDQAAVDAVRQWKFAPVQLNGVAQPVLMTLTVNFTLQ